MTHSFRHSWITAACLLSCSTWVLAQPVADPAAGVQRSVEQGIGNLTAPNQPLPQPERAQAPQGADVADIQKLVGVEVQAPAQLPKLADQIQDYWTQFLQKPVRGVQVNEFKSWLWDQLQRQGYLGYINIESKAQPDGALLQVTVKAPTIGQIQILTLESEQRDPLANLVAQRVAKALPAGSVVDVQAIDAELASIAFDLPVTLEASLRQLGSEKVDVVVNLKRVESNPGQFKDAVVQLNNYGLKTYGREQLLSVVRVQGPTALSEFTAVGQVSEGVRYLRGEYSQPIEGWATRARVSANVVRSGANVAGLTPVRQKGESSQWALGLLTLLNTSRQGTWHSDVELSQRQAESTSTVLSSGVTTVLGDRQDQQLRLALKSSHRFALVDRVSTETTLTLGRLKLGARDLNVGQPGVNDLQGSYQRLEHSGRLQNTLASHPQYTITARWKWQDVSQNMDGYSKMALGGVGGIRAFGSDEGVGDQGMQVSLDVTRQFTPNFYAGVFYDAGRVRTNKKPATSSYSLQGAGISVGGKVHPKVDWSLSMAKSHGSTPSQGINSKIGDWRAYFAANWRY